MKALLRTLLLLPLGLLLSPSARAQYTTPGTGGAYDLNDLVALSGGVFTVTDDTSFVQHATFTLADSDTLVITDNATWAVASGATINIAGRFEAAPPERLDLIAAVAGMHHQGIRIEESASVLITRTHLLQGGGIKCLTADLVITHSTIAEQVNNETTGSALEISRGKPVINQVEFRDNERSAISSGANLSVAPRITNCSFLRNGTENSNRPQINLGPSGADTTIIRNNLVLGDREHTMVGGIAFSSILGNEGHILVENNEVVDNRYGITVGGGGITSVVADNILTDNNSQGDPMAGGSGINFNGSATNVSMVYGNRISGNLWGITLQGNVTPNFGDTTTVSFNPGNNSFADNGHNGEVYALYNNTPNPIKAMNNCWDYESPLLDSAAVAAVITDISDVPTLGRVFFMPYHQCASGMAVEAPLANAPLHVYPNPSNGRFTIHSLGFVHHYALFNANGQVVRSGQLATQQSVSIEGLPAGLYILRAEHNGSLISKKIVLE